MIIRDGARLYSPSDLVAYLEGDFAAWMERRYAESQRGRAGEAGPNPGFRWTPDEEDPETLLVKRKGAEHEARVLAKLRAVHGQETSIARGDDAEPRTLEAMRRGDPLIYQGLLSAPPWHGYPDFLIRTAQPGTPGGWSYRPSDSKLAHKTKPYFLVQLCAYADLLERTQGVRPVKLGFILGNNTDIEYDTELYFHFYRHLKEEFERFQAAFDPAREPDPALEAAWGRWETAARTLLAEHDDLRLVARITRSQIKRLRDAGIRTMAGLVKAPGPRARMATDVLDRLRRQARLQIATGGNDRPVFEVLPPPPGRIGLAALPPPSVGDVFFDLEGFPHAEEGLEYLFGAVVVEDGPPRFHDWWAHNRAEERRAFETVVDWLHARWKADPAMHIYHYANYEPNALKKLMGKYGSRENEVDDLLRNEVFVDLYRVVLQGVAIGTGGYSLKDIECLFSPPRTALVMDASSSVAEYQRWLDSGEPANPAESPILGAIRDYNREDRESTWRLASWLREHQAEAGISYGPPVKAKEETEAEQTSPAEQLAERLLTAAEAEPDAERRRAGQLIAWLLGYHRREEKPMWWRYFDHLASTDEELFDAADCLAGVERTATPLRPEKKSQVAEYRFDPDQDTKLGERSRVYVLGGGEAVSNEIRSFDGESGLLTFKFGPSKAIPDRCNLIPNEYVSSEALQAAVFRFAERWAAGSSTSSAIEHLLQRRPPALTPARSGALIPAEPQLPDDLIALVQSLDQTTLCIQGPPGSGKTRNAAAVIAALAVSGKRIGISSNSHKAILNLLGAVSQAAASGGRAVQLLKVGGDETEEDLAAIGARPCESKEVAPALEAPGVVVGGTAWVFARPELEQRLDYLFIDEAGQVSLANAVAMGLSTRNIVLLGDQMQLAQPIQGTHPGDSGLSCLHYFLQGHATVPPDRGVFLPRTWRLHPDICRFISETAYDRRLESLPETAERLVVPPSDAARLRRGTGIVLVEVAHEGNTQDSEEEADRIVELVGELKRSGVQEDGKVRAFDLRKDLLIVAPYNAQVRLLRDRLGADVDIASVDKFQGREATVVIVSMCASSVEETPRGAGFLLDPNRLNVAISRARCLAIVVASTTLVRARPNTVREMELLNLFCRLRYYARQP